MRIPDGDLVPARRRSRYGGGYGRRRRRRTRGYAVGLLVLAVIAATGWWLNGRSPTSSSHATRRPCPSPSPVATAPALPAPAQVHVVILNGTAQNGLAQQVGHLLSARGFVVLRSTNAPAAVPGAAQVVYGPGGQPAATVLAQAVLGARLVAAASGPVAGAAGAVQLVLGGEFRNLAAPAPATPSPTLAVQPAVPAGKGTRTSCGA